MQVESVRKVPGNLSSFLKMEYAERKNRNKQYSLRSFARDIDISSGKLSDILNGKVGISATTADNIADHLKLSPEDRSFFKLLVEMNSEKDPSLEKKLYQFNSKYVLLPDDHYNVLSEWYYFALAELIALEEFQNNDQWIAERLKIPVELVRPAIERLIRVQLIEEVEGKFVQTYDYFVSPSGTPSDAAKKFHRQILDLAKEAILKQSIEERNYTSGFVRVRKSDLGYIDQRIRDFRRELAKELESGDGHDSVYAFSIQFFRAD